MVYVLCEVAYSSRCMQFALHMKARKRKQCPLNCCISV